MPSEHLERAREGRRGARTVDDLRDRLRRETADLHRAVEASTGLPRSVGSISDYVALLQRLHDFHEAVEAVLVNPQWETEWHELDLDVKQHRRAHLLENDLLAMSAPLLSPRKPLAHVDTFAAALGCLYVAEGSSLGGRVIGPAIRAALGEVPTSFFDSDGRAHPSPWRSVTSALQRYGGRGDDDAVIEGARVTFRAFERHVSAASVERA